MSGRKQPRKLSKSKGGGAALRWWAIALIAFLSLVAAFKVYGPALAGPVLFDDWSFPYALPSSAKASSSWLMGVRPVLMLSYWLNVRLFGPGPFSYHVVNVILHTINAILAGLIFRRVLLSYSTSSGKASILAAAAGAVFLLHPLQTEAVAYIAGRSELVSGAFVLAAFLVFLYQPLNSLSWRGAVAIVLLYACAVLSKEQAAILPAVFLATDLCLYRFSWRGALKRGWRLYASLAAAAVFGLAFVWRVLQTSASAGFRLEGLPWHEYFFTQCRVWFLYVRLFIFPAWQNADYDVAISRTILQHGALVWMAAAMLVAAAAWHWRRRYALGVFGLLIFALLLAPTSSVVPIKDVAVERRMYLPSVGLLLIGLEALVRVRVRPALVGGITALMLVLGALTHARAAVWSSDINFWTDTLRDSRGKVRGYTHLMVAYLRAHRCGHALATASEVPVNVRDTPEFLTVWGYALQCAGRKADALEKLKRATVLEPGVGRFLVLGKAYQDLGMLRDAQVAYKQALAREPRTVFDRRELELYRASLARSRAPTASPQEPADNNNQGFARSGPG